MRVVCHVLIGSSLRSADELIGQYVLSFEKLCDVYIYILRIKYAIINNMSVEHVDMHVCLCVLVMKDRICCMIRYEF